MLYEVASGLSVPRKLPLRLALLILAMCQIYQSASATQVAEGTEPDLTVATIAGPPLPTVRGSNRASEGIGINEAKAAFSHCGLTAKFLISPSWNRAFSMAAEGHVDALIPTNKKQERLALFHFPEKPFKKMTVVLFTNSSNPASEYSGLAMLKDARFGKLAGSSLEPDLDRFIADGYVRLFERTTVISLYEGIMRGRIDYVAEVLEHSGPFLKALKAEKHIKALSPPIGVTPLYIAISKKGSFASNPASPKFQCIMGAAK